jgi:SAM-dependent methyltransferase
MAVFQAGLRDTDADWHEIGAADPHWGVLTAPEFRRENLRPAAVETFYASGRRHIAEVAAAFTRITGAPFHAGTALDFGCGAGRLTEAMAAYADHVTGYDISPGMLDAARSRGGTATCAGELPAARFDWINAFIVFQHIPPARGMKLLDQLLARLAPGGCISLHFTIYRDPHIVPPLEAAAGRLRRLPRPLRVLVRRLHRRLKRPAPVGLVSMYDYDLGRIVETLNRAGFARLLMIHDDHGGHHGVNIIGRHA